MSGQDSEREMFEAWRRSTTKMDPDSSVALQGFGDDAPYQNEFTRMAWNAWIARASLPQSRAGGDAVQLPPPALILGNGNFYNEDQMRAALAHPKDDSTDADGDAFRKAAELGLTLRFYGGCAQSSAPVAQGLSDDLLARASKSAYADWTDVPFVSVDSLQRVLREVLAVLKAAQSGGEA